MTTRVSLITLILMFIWAFSFAQQSGQLLQKAYKDKSIAELNNFFENWKKEVKPYDAKEYNRLSDTIKNACQVFTAFYQPLSIERLGGSEWGAAIYDKVDYLVVQNSTKIFFTDKIYSEDDLDFLAVKTILKSNLTDSLKGVYLKRRNGKLSPIVLERFGRDLDLKQDKEMFINRIVDFRPLIDITNKKAIYLTPRYDTILNAFLGNSHLKLGAGGIMNPARLTGESAKRQQFLQNSIKIWYGHWGGYWQLYSYPTATSITFDKSMIYAKVSFRMVYEGGEAILKNNNGRWELLSARRTWIE